MVPRGGVLGSRFANIARTSIPAHCCRWGGGTFFTGVLGCVENILGLCWGSRIASRNIRISFPEIAPLTPGNNLPECEQLDWVMSQSASSLGPVNSPEPKPKDGASTNGIASGSEPGKRFCWSLIAER